jgi:hypothetical protein
LATLSQTSPTLCPLCAKALPLGEFLSTWVRKRRFDHVHVDAFMYTLACHLAGNGHPSRAAEFPCSPACQATFRRRGTKIPSQSCSFLCPNRTLESPESCCVACGQVTRSPHRQRASFHPPLLRGITVEHLPAMPKPACGFPFARWRTRRSSHGGSCRILRTRPVTTPPQACPLGAKPHQIPSDPMHQATCATMWPCSRLIVG